MEQEGQRWTISMASASLIILDSRILAKEIKTSSPPTPAVPEALRSGWPQARLILDTQRLTQSFRQYMKPHDLELVNTSKTRKAPHTLLMGGA